MASAGQVPQKKIWDMLDECAPGWNKNETDHFICLRWKSRTYPSFPKHPQVDIGHIRKMVRELGVDKACSQKQIEALR